MDILSECDKINEAEGDRTSLAKANETLSNNGQIYTDGVSV